MKRLNIFTYDRQRWAIVLVIMVLTNATLLVGAMDVKTRMKSDKSGNEIRKKDRSKQAEKDLCPRLCFCPTPEKVDCSHAQLTYVPHNISRKALHLLLNENKLSTIGSECFKECPSVRTLNLHGNKLSDDGLSLEAFGVLSRLKHLHLSHNKLRKIPAFLPNSLTTLHLEGNLIDIVDRLALASKRQLKHLYLHKNNITGEAVSKHAFRSLSRLKEVTLSDNLITRIPNIPAAVEQVSLQNNYIRTIPNQTFRRNRRLIALYVQNNKLTNSQLFHASFLGLTNLEYLDLSGNQLTEVPDNLPKSVKRLHLEKNDIWKITPKAFSHLKNLEYLLLQHNKLNSSGVAVGSFAPLRRLNTLHIFMNSLTVIPPLLPPRLESLVILSNKIDSMKRNTFYRSRNIRDLNLRYNDLTNRKIERGAFTPLPKIATIDLTGNKLTAVPSLPKNVEVVYLSNNKIVRIPKKSIAKLTRLRHLALNGNRLKNTGIPEDAFRNCSSVKVLDLSSNLLKVIPRYLPPGLEYLYLQNNQISTIGKTAFVSSPMLSGIFLRENNLQSETVSIAAFNSLRFLRRVEITWAPPTSYGNKKRKRRNSSGDTQVQRN